MLHYLSVLTSMQPTPSAVVSQDRIELAVSGAGTVRYNKGNLAALIYLILSQNQ